MHWLWLFYILAVSFDLAKVSARPGVCKRNDVYDLYPPKDYCTEPNQPHLACNNKNNWDKENCGKPLAIYAMTTGTIDLIVKQHNTYRNNVARGYIREAPAAARMLKMHWDNNLAKLAELAVKRCTLDPISESYSTSAASKPGFNAIYSKYPNTQTQDEHKILRSHLKAWYDQSKYITYDSLKSGKTAGGQEISNFLQLMTGLNNRVGCAIATYLVGPWKVQSMVCLYACQRQENQLSYEFGRRPGESCHCGTDWEFRSLCSAQEPVNDCSKLGGSGEKPDRYNRPTQRPSHCFGLITCFVEKLVNTKI